MTLTHTRLLLSHISKYVCVEKYTGECVGGIITAREVRRGSRGKYLTRAKVNVEVIRRRFTDRVSRCYLCFSAAVIRSS